MTVVIRGSKNGTATIKIEAREFLFSSFFVELIVTLKCFGFVGCAVRTAVERRCAGRTLPVFDKKNLTLRTKLERKSNVCFMAGTF